MASPPASPPSAGRPPVRVRVNGVVRELAPGTTLEALLAGLAVDAGRVAVAVNAAVVPRAEHTRRALAEHDDVEVIEPVGGG